MGTSDSAYFPWHKKLAYNLEPIFYGKEGMNSLSIAETQAPLIYYYLKKINISFKEIKSYDFCDQQNTLNKYIDEEGFTILKNQTHIKGDFNN